MTVTVREATHDDAAAIQQIFDDAGLHADEQTARIYAESYVAVTDDGYVVGAIEGRFDVAFEEDITPAGFEEGAWLDQIAVVAEHQRGKIGRALVNRFAFDALEAGCTHAAGFPHLGSDPVERVASLPGVRVEIHHEPESWAVEARQGGPEGESKRWRAANETEAKNIANQLMRTNERWRAME